MYSLEDLVVFTVDGWFGLYETVNSQYWPLQILGGMWALLSILIHCKGLQSLLPISVTGLAGLWLACAYVFFFGEYKQLSWVGSYYGWAFSLQALILLALFTGFRSLFLTQSGDKNTGLSTPVIYCIFITGFIITPLIGLIEGRNWASLDIIGTGPDSLALITIAWVLLNTKQKFLTIIFCIIPTAWLIVSASNAWPMGLIQGIFGPTTLFLALICLFISFFINKRD